MDTKKAYISAISYSLFIGLSFLFVKLALPYSSPLLILAHRFSIAFILFTIYILINQIKIPFSKDYFLALLPLSLLYPIAFFTFQIYGLTYIASAEAGILFAIVPILTLILAHFLINETSSLIQNISMTISVIGVIYIFIMNGANFENTNSFGLVLIILSSFSVALYTVFAKHVLKKIGFIQISYGLTFLGFVSFNIIYLILGQEATHFSAYFLPFNNITYLSSVVYLSLFSSVMSLVLSTYSLTVLTASKMSIFSNLATLISIFAGIAFLNEQLFYYHFIGAVLILAGITGTNIESFIAESKKLKH